MSKFDYCHPIDGGAKMMCHYPNGSVIIFSANGSKDETPGSES